MILVVFVFLQNWRATLIPLLTVPVSLVATFIVFPMLGFSINTLSLLGMVLAIGIVVDDAIVVVEAVMHHIEQGMSPKEATLKAMEEVSGPVVAIALILAAVFVPVAFMGGITGRLYQQFAITIAISVLFSAFNALTLSPALAAMLLKPKGESASRSRSSVLRWFNKVFDRFTGGYLCLHRHCRPEDRPEHDLHRRRPGRHRAALTSVPGGLRPGGGQRVLPGQSSSSPMRARSSGRTRSAGRSRRFSRTPRGSTTTRRSSGYSLITRCRGSQRRRVLLRIAETLGGAEGEGGAVASR